MNEFKGFSQIDGTVPGFTIDGLEDGYFYLNGKKYGQEHNIDCGKY